jgi:hypothetical protein
MLGALRLILRSASGRAFVLTAGFCFGVTFAGSYVLTDDRTWTLAGVFVAAVLFGLADCYRPSIAQFPTRVYTVLRLLATVAAGIFAAGTLALLTPSPSAVIRSAAALSVSYVTCVPLLGSERERWYLRTLSDASDAVTLAYAQAVIADGLLRGLLVLAATATATIADLTRGAWVVAVETALAGTLLSFLAYLVGCYGMEERVSPGVRRQIGPAIAIGEAAASSAWRVVDAALGSARATIGDATYEARSRTLLWRYTIPLSMRARVADASASWHRRRAARQRRRAARIRASATRRIVEAEENLVRATDEAIEIGAGGIEILSGLERVVQERRQRGAIAQADALEAHISELRDRMSEPEK